jgi:hypothetical protein
MSATSKFLESIWILELPSHTYTRSTVVIFKGTVTQELRWILLYLNGKLFSGAFTAH